ncbi:MAG: hypothetical protein LBU03_04055 [Tannerellaceae bacterium]|jgi:hypothetical protein|nr:hypothetical protein [Tannerellaceae bacterium]
MISNYDAFSETSLKDFYEGYLNELEGHGKMLKAINRERKGEFNVNHFLLIFEAIRILPSFSKNIENQYKKELKAWMNVVSAARVNREIKTKMSDEQIAKHFIYLNDGIELNLTMDGQAQKVRKELQTAWDAFYAMIKNNNLS